MKVFRALVLGLMIGGSVFGAEWTDDDFSGGVCDGVQIKTAQAETYLQLQERSGPWLSGYKYRRAVTINNSGTNTLTDYQTPIRFLKGDSIYTNGGTNSIRVCNSDGTNTLSHYIENWDTNSTSTIWTKLNIPAGTKTIYVYYGNPSATDTSNFDGVFTKDYGESGLVGLWHMDEGTGGSIADSSGNGNTGTLMNGPTWQSTDGGQWDGMSDVKFGTGSHLSFNGSNNYVLVPNNASLNSAQNTLEVWAKFYPYPTTNGAMIGKYAPSGNYEGYCMTVNTAGYDSVWMRINGAPWWIGGAYTWNYSNWHHIVGTCDGATSKIYVDGALFISSPEAFATSSVDLSLGASYAAGTYYFNGFIDDLRIYNRALSADEIKRQYYRSKYAHPEPTVATGEEEGLYTTTSGTFTSSVCNSGLAQFGTLTWAATATAECGINSLGFQVSVDGGTFFGTDGASNSYYYTTPAAIDRTGNSIAYRTFFHTADTGFSPRLNIVTVIYESLIPPKGAVFEEDSYSFQVERDYNQQRILTIRNEDNQPRTVTVGVINTYDDLVAGFIGDAGAGSGAITLNADESRNLILAIHTPDATQKTYDIKGTVMSDNGVSDETNIHIEVRQPIVRLRVEYIGEDLDTIAKNYKIINDGDVITDLSAYLEDGLLGKVMITPSINHGRIEKGKSITVKLIPIIGEGGWTGCKGWWYVDAVGSTTHIATYVEWKLQPGKEVYEVILDHPKLFFDMRDWYCINKPSFVSRFYLPGFKSVNFNEAKLKVEFIPWYAGNHKVNIYMNSDLIGDVDNPQGYHTFNINSASLNYGDTNSIRVNTQQLPSPGHYAATTNMRVLIVLNSATMYVVAEDQASANETVWSLPYIHRNSDTLKVEIVSPAGGLYKIGEGIFIKAKVTDDQGVSQWLCDVTASFNNNDPQITLCDDSEHSDDSLNDGVYANYWVPKDIPEEGRDVLITVMAKNCKTNAQTTVNIHIGPNHAPTGTMTTPAEGENLEGQYEIKWEATDLDSQDTLSYSLYYSASSIGPWSLLVEGLPQTQKYWEWDTTHVSNGTYFLRLVVSDGALTGEDIVRVIVTNPIYAAITAPESNQFIRGEVIILGSANGDGFSHYILTGTGLSINESTPISNGKLGDWNTTGLNGTYTIKLEVFSADGSSTVATLTVVVDNESPIVNITSPNNGVEVSGTVTVTVTAQDNGSGIAKLEFYIDGTMQGITSYFPYAWEWNTAGHSGECEVKVIAYDLTGNSSQAIHTVIVNSYGTGTIIRLSPATAITTLYSQFNVGVIVENVNNLSGAMVEVVFDKTLLKATSCKQGPFFEPGSVTFYPIIKEDRVIINTSGLNKSVSGTGVFGTITFCSISSGTTRIDFGKVDLRNSELIRILIAGLISATVEVKGYLADFGGLDPDSDAILETPDYKIDFYDLMLFTDNWKGTDTRYDIGPAEGTPPYITPQPDGTIDIDDLAVFAMMWNWYYSPSTGSSKSTGLLEKARAKIVFDKKEGIAKGDELEADLLIEDVNDLMACHFELGFDPKMIELVSIEKGKFLSQDGGQVVFLSEIKKERVELNIGILGGNPQGISGSGVIARLKFKALVDEPITRVEITISDIRNLQNRKIEVESVDAQLGSLPSANALLQSFPNPVTGDGVWIPFKLSADTSQVTVDIYNIVGQKVKEISAGSRKAGSYTQAKEGRAIFWNKKNEQGMPVADGLYFYNLKADDFFATKSMVITK